MADGGVPIESPNSKLRAFVPLRLKEPALKRLEQTSFPLYLALLKAWSEACQSLKLPFYSPWSAFVFSHEGTKKEKKAEDKKGRSAGVGRFERLPSQATGSTGGI